NQLLSDCTCRDGFACAWRGVDQKATILPIIHKPLECLAERFKLPWAKFSLHFRTLFQITSRTKRLAVLRDGRSAFRIRNNVICVKPIVDTFPALATFSSGDPSEDPTLSSVEATVHRITQYSVIMTSRIGKFDGGFRTACSLTRFIAFAYGTTFCFTVHPSL